MSKSPPSKRLLSLSEIAEIAGIDERTIRNYIAAGQVIAYRVGPKTIRLDIAEFECAMVTRVVGPTPATLRRTPPGRAVH